MCQCSEVICGHPTFFIKILQFLTGGTSCYRLTSVMSIKWLLIILSLTVNIVQPLHTHTHPFNGPFSGTTWTVSRYQTGKPIWILLKQETVSGSSISWAVCKSASHSRQITTPAPHHSLFTGRMLFLPPNQQCQSTEGLLSNLSNGWYFLPDIWKSLHV